MLKLKLENPEFKMHTKFNEVCLVQMNNGVESVVVFEDGQVDVTANENLLDVCEICEFSERTPENLEKCETCNKFVGF